MTSASTKPDAAEPAADSGTAHPAAPAPRTVTGGTPPKGDHTLAFALLLAVLAYVALAHALGFRLPDLVDPWRSIVAITATVPAVFWALALAVQGRALGARHETRALAALGATSYVAWFVLLCLVVRTHGDSDDLLVVAVCFVAVLGLLGVPATCLIYYIDPPAEAREVAAPRAAAGGAATAAKE